MYGQQNIKFCKFCTLFILYVYGIFIYAVGLHPGYREGKPNYFGERLLLYRRLQTFQP